MESHVVCYYLNESNIFGLLCFVSVGTEEGKRMLVVWKVFDVDNRNGTFVKEFDESEKIMLLRFGVSRERT